MITELFLAAVFLSLGVLVCSYDCSCHPHIQLSFLLSYGADCNSTALGVSGSGCCCFSYFETSPLRSRCSCYFCSYQWPPVAGGAWTTHLSPSSRSFSTPTHFSPSVPCFYLVTKSLLLALSILPAFHFQLWHQRQKRLVVNGSLNQCQIYLIQTMKMAIWFVLQFPHH